MNWYDLLKFAQIWEVASDGWFIDEIKRMYELEYKLAMIERHMSGDASSFSKRMQNIVKHVERELLDALNNVKQPLVNVFSNWLDNH